MPRYVSVADHLSTDELKRRYQTASDPVVGRRYHLLWLLKQGHRLPAAAPLLGWSYAYAKRVVYRYNHHGPDTLENGRKRVHRRGRPPLLDEEQQTQLRQALNQPPADGGLWTGPKVARWMAEVLEVERVRPQRGWDYLKRFGYSWQRPRPRHRQADSCAQAEFKKPCPSA